MSGITGIVGTYGESLMRMTNALVHRGPDDAGMWADEKAGIFLGHRRLSILDLPHGVQPFRAENDSAVLVYNGELYNHCELRNELISLGHTFISEHSDTETVLRSYVEWGIEAVARFNGMFALAVWDKQKQTLFLARDRFGEKPLFYTRTHSGLAFASELGALKLWTGFSGSVNTDNMQKFLAWGYFPGETTLYKDCWSLPPGSWISFHPASGTLNRRQYWQFTLEPDHSLEDKDIPRLAEELRERIIRSVERRLASDVSLGCFLSGGIDSSCVLAAMAKFLPPDNIKAFTIGFTEKSFDESGYAIQVAKHFGVRHKVRILDQSHAVDMLDSVLPRLADPLGDPSILPTYLLSKFTRESVTVALSGDGGDELFAGYDPLKALTPARLYSRCIPVPLHKLARMAVEMLPNSDHNMSLEFKIKRTLRGLSYPAAFWLPAWMGPLEPLEMGAFFDHPLSTEELYAEALHTFENNQHLSMGDRALLFFTRHYLQQGALVKADRATMLNSLESRAVFLDNEIVDFCSRLPYSFKFSEGKGKRLLRTALAGWLPKEILDRPKKGFGIPLNQWLRGMSLAFDNLEGYINMTSVRKAVAAHVSRRGDYRLFLWALLSLDRSLGARNA